MPTQEESTSPFTVPPSRIYQTDPFGFPLHAADEDIYNKDIEEQQALVAARMAQCFPEDNEEIPQK